MTAKSSERSFIEKMVIGEDKGQGRGRNEEDELTLPADEGATVSRWRRYFVYEI